jgi:hypothetical protein
LFFAPPPFTRPAGDELKGSVTLGTLRGFQKYDEWKDVHGTAGAVFELLSSIMSSRAPAVPLFGDGFGMPSRLVNMLYSSIASKGCAT